MFLFVLSGRSLLCLRQKLSRKQTVVCFIPQFPEFRVGVLFDYLDLSRDRPETRNTFRLAVF